MSEQLSHEVANLSVLLRSMEEKQRQLDDLVVGGFQARMIPRIDADRVTREELEGVQQAVMRISQGLTECVGALKRLTATVELMALSD